MSTPQGAVAPYQGEVIQPTKVTGPADRILHEFVTVVETLVRNSPAFHTEEEILTALRSLNAYRKHILGGNVASVVQEGEIAHVEDVSKRIPPGGSQVRTAPSNPYSNLDYRKLAEAMLAVQQDQSTVHEITDAQNGGTTPPSQPYSQG